ncbi:hypothetical protein [Phaeobacter inhibens]|uniref:hypothetical protein n=1 Tax=Phaeobacter inhibens TaxID=221822 RepID=UPI002492FD5D|nr:hypothetical protein [Phaeobacter inhibens]
MADYSKGEVSGRVRGRVKTLCLDMAALERFEALQGQDAFSAIEEMRGDDAGFATLRRLVQSAMAKHHPDATLAEAQAFIAKHADKIRAMLQRALPEPETDEDVAESAPGKPAGATG